MQDEPKIGVMIADDHNLVRAGIRSLLEKLPGIQVLADTGNSTEVLELLDRHAPDIILLDIAMPVINGIELAERISEKLAAVRIIILSMHDQGEYVLRALRAGAAAYLLKDSAVAELELAIQAVMRGDTFLSPVISRKIVDHLMQHPDGDSREPDPLTARQREILQLIAQGRSTKQVAFLLNISIKTVESHRAQIMSRLDIHDVPGLVRYAMRIGLISPEV